MRVHPESEKPSCEDQRGVAPAKHGVSVLLNDLQIMGELLSYTKWRTVYDDDERGKRLDHVHNGFAIQRDLYSARVESVEARDNRGVTASVECPAWDQFQILLKRECRGQVCARRTKVGRRNGKQKDD